MLYQITTVPVLSMTPTHNYTSQLKKAMSRILDDLQPALIGGVPVSSGIFETSEKQAITDAAERIKCSGGVCVFVSVSDSVSAVVSSGTELVNSSAILKDAMIKFNGRGGGKADFAQGGMPDLSQAHNVYEYILLSVKEALKQEN